MKYFPVLFVLISILFSQERYSQVQIPVANATELNRIAELGIAVDHFDGKIGGKISLFLSASEQKKLDESNVPYIVTIKDWQQYYNEQQSQQTERLSKTSSDVPKYFRYGIMGGNLVYSEIIQQLDSMKLLFPNLIKMKETLGSSIEGREIFVVKISDNPDTDESNEPEVLYTALHHAREPQGMMTVIYYMWWLLENYGKDPEATYLVNNRQMWFVPVVNPDGYQYNYTIIPSGGGMNRKNRRDNGDGTFGVDLNRNYGPFLMWDAPNGGSSSSKGSDTYRGPAPFSEPETQAIRNFMQTQNIKTCFNYHTYSNLLIYPWGYSSAESSDSLLFRMWSFDMSAVNRYAIGTDLQTVGYSTRGNSDDFMYGDSSKPRTYAMTPEVGTTGFWPTKSEIYPLAQENLLQNKLLAYYAGSFLSVKSFIVNDSTFNNNSITIRIINKGLSEGNFSKIFFKSNVGTVTPEVTFGSIASFAEKEVTISFSGNVDGPLSNQVKIYIKDSTNALLNDSILFISGPRIVLFEDSANSTTLWSNGSGWGVVTDIARNSNVFTDSPTGNYLPNSNNSLTLLTPIDLSTYQYAELKFRTQWAIESVWDFGTVEVSTNGGTNWVSLKTQFSRKGSGRVDPNDPLNIIRQPSNLFIYDAFTPGLTWIEQTADLTPYVGKQIKIRFRVAADGGVQRDGLYVDDIYVFGYKFTPSSINELVFPFTYSLSQNFPNPFNPTTAINFSIEKPNNTTLRIYDVLGKEVAVLVNQFTESGNYSVKFDAKQLSSGIYFYRLTTGNFSSIKKMVVLK